MRIYGVNLKVWKPFLMYLTAAFVFDILQGGQLYPLENVLAAFTVAGIATFVQAQFAEKYRGRVIWEQRKQQK